LKKWNEEYTSLGTEGEHFEYGDSHESVVSSEMIRHWIFSNRKTQRKAGEIEGWDPNMMKESPDDSKTYPGSYLGPEVEDDPDNWANWYINSRPQTIYQGELWEP
jgi:hypothetical protein